MFPTVKLDTYDHRFSDFNFISFQPDLCKCIQPIVFISHSKFLAAFIVWFNICIYKKILKFWKICVFFLMICWKKMYVISRKTTKNRINKNILASAFWKSTYNSLVLFTCAIHENYWR